MNIKEELKNFIQDQQSHEVENETILDKIPNLVEYLSDQNTLQVKKELIEEVRAKILKLTFPNGSDVSYSAIEGILDDLSKK